MGDAPRRPYLVAVYRARDVYSLAFLLCLSCWTVSAVVPLDRYVLEAWPPPDSGWLPRAISLTASAATGEWVITQSVALLPQRASVFIPLVYGE
jgi:hypothetical protein